MREVDGTGWKQEVTVKFSDCWYKRRDSGE